MNQFLFKYLKASSVLLLAFGVHMSVWSQEIISLSGANSLQDDLNPVWIGDGTLLFTRANFSDNIGGKTDEGDIWMVQKTPEGNWGEAIHRKDLSTSGYDVALGMENSITLLIYHRDEGADSGIHQYAKFGLEWKYRRKIEIDGIEEFSGKVTGSVSYGGDLIFISGNSPSSKGNEDIFVSEKVTGITWSKPENLGTIINTFGQEVSPFYDPKTNLLYFSTNNQPGSQGKDMYIAKYLGPEWEDWSNPVNWEKINTAGSEMSMTFVGTDEIVWTSTQNSNGFADLLTFAKIEDLEIPKDYSPALRRSLSREEPTKSIESVSPVYTKESALKPISPLMAVGKPEIAMFFDSVLVVEKPLQWLAIDANQKIGLPFSIQFLSDKNSVSLIKTDSLKISDLRSESVDEIRAEVDGYFPKSISIADVIDTQPNVFLMVKVTSGSSIKLDRVNFKRGTSDLEGLDTELALKEIATFLLENSEVVVRIHGHTDNAGDPTLNKKLSLERAGSVRDFLIDQGVEFERMRISGWGGSRPIASNATESGRAKNRRVEMEVQ